MVRLWAILFALAVAYAAALMVTATFAKATQQLGGNAAAASPSDFERLHSTRVSEGAQHNHGAR